MSLSVIAAAVVFFGSVVLSQKLAANAAGRLDDATKLRIAEIFPRRNVNFSIIVFAIVILFLVGLYLLPEYALTIAVVYAFAFLAYIFAKLGLNTRKLRQIGAPDHYVRSIKVSFAVFIAGSVFSVCVAFAASRFYP